MRSGRIKLMLKNLWTGILPLAAVAGLMTAVPPAAAAERTRLIVLTDIGNEPDDSESMVRLLLYANEFDIEGLIATTSTWQRDQVQPRLIEERVRAYGQVLPNLRRHAQGYPAATALLGLIQSGRSEYGMQGVGEGKDTAASQRIIEAVDRPDPRPVWITVWGGAVDLAQALWRVRSERSPAEVAAFVAKLRVYSISDQDDAGPWARRNFPDLFWIASIHGFSDYGQAAWFGVSGDLMRPVPGADISWVSKDWLAAHIQKGPLGALYPAPKYIMEGDTPSFLYLISNGLGDPEHPDYGSWGGRYAKVSAADGLFADVTDTAVGADGKTYRTYQAGVWRWRSAYQSDFAARMAWTLTPDPAAANHAPAAVLNGRPGREPVTLTVKAGDRVRLSAAGSSDPDDQALTYRWTYYREAGAGGHLNPELRLDGAESQNLEFTAPQVAAKTDLHVLLEVRDAGGPSLVSYRRAIVAVVPG